jgi:hypothetical protein
VALGAGPAEAAPIRGSFDITGIVIPVNGVQATGTDFLAQDLTNPDIGTGRFAVVNGQSLVGDLTGAAGNDPFPTLSAFALGFLPNNLPFDPSRIRDMAAPFGPNTPAPTPEPASLLLLGTGALLGFRSYQKRLNRA